MGWSSWNHFRQAIDESTILSAAQAMAASPLAAAGYRYINLDDCWQSSERDASGALQFNHTTFPSGPQLLTRIHNMGLKVGLYSSCGPLTCEDLPASFGHERRDAQTFAAWGIDFLKYDYCHVIDLTTDEQLLKHSPQLVGVSLRHCQTGEVTELPLTTARLTGQASIQTASDGLPTLVGLGADSGTASFAVSALAPGDYYLSIVYLKTRAEHRQLLLAHNGARWTNLFFPPSSGWSVTGRLETRLTLTDPDQPLILTNPVHDRHSDAIWRYQTMHQALADADPRINFAVCEHGRNRPWEWAPSIANSYRISEDIQNYWASVMSCYDQLLACRPFALAGSYADPDMLEVGNGVLTPDENRAHFTLWAFLSAPLVLGNDIRNWREDNDWLTTVTNPAVIRVNQTTPHLPAQLLASRDRVDVLAKYLSTGEAALCFFNRGDWPVRFTFDLATLPATIEQQAFTYHGQPLVELWDQTNFTLDGPRLTLELAPHAVSAFTLADTH